MCTVDFFWLARLIYPDQAKQSKLWLVLRKSRFKIPVLYTCVDISEFTVLCIWTIHIKFSGLVCVPPGSVAEGVTEKTSRKIMAAKTSHRLGLQQLLVSRNKSNKESLTLPIWIQTHPSKNRPRQLCSKFHHSKPPRCLKFSIKKCR